MRNALLLLAHDYSPLWAYLAEHDPETLEKVGQAWQALRLPAWERDLRGTLRNPNHNGVQPIMWVKRIRQETGMALKEAKDAYEKVAWEERGNVASRAEENLRAHAADGEVTAEEMDTYAEALRFQKGLPFHLALRRVEEIIGEFR